MPTPNSQTNEEAGIRKIMDDRTKAVYDKDIDTLMSAYAPDVVSFDAVNPLQNTGSDAVKKRAEQWFSWYEGPIGCEIINMIIAAADEAAFCHYLYRISGNMTNGKNVNMWLRATLCFRKQNGNWIITHEHTSVPFEVESGKASMELKP